MKVKAICNLLYNGEWKRGGDQFEVSKGDYDAIKDFVVAKEQVKPDSKPEETEDFVSDVFPPEVEKQEPPKRGRRKKTQTQE